MEHLNLTTHWAGIASLICFALAYGAAMAEERLQVRKSVPVLVAAALIWIFVGIAAAQVGAAAEVADAARHTILEFGELLLFLIPAMTYVNTLENRGLFDVLRVWLVRRGLSLRALFWVTGALAFVVSPIADNLTTALLGRRRSGCGPRPSKVCHAGVYQCRGRRQRRWCIQPFRRHHHAHGLAGGQGRVHGVLCTISAITRQLDR